MRNMKFRIARLLAVVISALSVVSCNFGDEQEIDYETVSMITEFAFNEDIKVYDKYYVLDKSGKDSLVIDTTYISKEDCKFTIDQNNKQIYNVDSLPYGTDVTAMKATIDYKGYNLSRVLREEGEELIDTVFSNTDQVDYTKPVRFKVYAQVINVTDVYTVDVRVHKVDPDKMEWKKVFDSFSGGEVTGEQRSVLFGNKIYTYAEVAGYDAAVYVTDASGTPSWTRNYVTAGEKLNINSACVYGGYIYMTSVSGNVYRSADGVAWTRHNALGGGIKTFVGAMDYEGGRRLIALGTDGAGRVFKVTDDGETWNGTTAQVPATFPEDCFSCFERRSKTNSSINNFYAMGREPELGAISDTASFSWFTLDGIEWSDMKTNYVLRLPKMTKPTYIYYGDETLAFGTGPKYSFNSFYRSEEYGLVWRECEDDPELPEAFNGRGMYSALVDNDNYIWVIWSSSEKNSDEVWRGKLNRTYFTD